MNPRFKMSLEGSAQVRHFNWGSSYFNVARTTVLHMFWNDQRHVTAFRLISEAAHSWSNDNTRWVYDVLSYYWTLSVLSHTIANDRQWPLVLILGQFPDFVSISVYATEREEHDTLQRHQRTISWCVVWFLRCVTHRQTDVHITILVSTLSFCC